MNRRRFRGLSQEEPTTVFTVQEADPHRPLFFDRCYSSNGSSPSAARGNAEVMRVGYRASSWPAVNVVSPAVLAMRGRMGRQRRQMDPLKSAALAGITVCALGCWMLLGIAIGLTGVLSLVAFGVGTLGLYALWPWRGARETERNGRR